MNSRDHLHSLIIPGEPESSSLYYVVAQGIMPKGSPPLSAGEVQAIYQWIKNGASPLDSENDHCLKSIKDLTKRLKERGYWQASFYHGDIDPELLYDIREWAQEDASRQILLQPEFQAMWADVAGYCGY